MFLDKYYSEVGTKVQFTRQQGSGFAKEIADDFNPLHDPDAKLFCVPGDLLFAIALAKYGLSIDEVIQKIQRHNNDISAGSVDIDRR